ncbi:hypothetical protein GK047_20495 [Paenibacillus sp. SYP-B3998]|uniref:Uncharacterized protein n=1 Tax=Paenibacillus sp. SYP-B3998 TaxID=2678564 RepID=A0A6G4A222_9BACL|nr:hypothetical protein [Paenibacillus sp. SYP-B3998]NEW08380.1 hypothetical protein [Paenibacillus sp. SYP-B3998]
MIYAIRIEGEKTHGGTIYVTLEPCSYHRRTGTAFVEGIGVDKMKDAIILGDVSMRPVGVDSRFVGYPISSNGSMKEGIHNEIWFRYRRYAH